MRIPVMSMRGIAWARRGHGMGTVWAQLRGVAMGKCLQEKTDAAAAAHPWARLRFNLQRLSTSSTDIRRVGSGAVPRWIVGDLFVHTHPGCPPVDH
jgi:hypothetical protein